LFGRGCYGKDVLVSRHCNAAHQRYNLTKYKIQNTK